MRSVRLRAGEDGMGGLCGPVRGRTALPMVLGRLLDGPLLLAVDVPGPSSSSSLKDKGACSFSGSR